MQKLFYSNQFQACIIFIQSYIICGRDEPLKNLEYVLHLSYRN